MRPKVRWKDDGQNHIRRVEIFNWSQVAQDRKGWKKKLRMHLTFLDSAFVEDEELSRDEGGEGGRELFLSAMK